MKRFLSTLIFAFLILSLSGCEIKYTALTKINPDGTGFRITTYSAEDENEKEELLTKYNLPTGGNWKSEKYIGRTLLGPSESHIYEVKKAFKDLNKFTPDYIRKGIKPQNISDNKISFKIKKGIIFTTYEYEEVFKDSTDERQIKEFGERYYNDILDIAAREVEVVLPRILKKEEIRIFLNENYRTEFEHLLTAFLKYGYNGFLEDNKELEKKFEDFYIKLSEDNFSSLIANYALENKKDVDKEELLNKLKDAYKRIQGAWSSYAGELDEKNYGDYLGVYGLPILVRYPFQVSVIMPGKIISSNAKDIKLNTAKWSFSRENFFLKEYKLEAKSRRLNHLNIIGLALSLTAILILAALRSNFSKRKS